jgi:[acyl-carrier-protein] S-malonyltransferase
MEREALEALCAETEGVVVIANDNSPGQLVISGEVAAVEAASQAAKEKGAKRVIPLPVSGAFHSPLMREPARQMGEALRHATFSTPEIPVYANVTAAPEAEGWAELLERQLASPVRWTETILRMRADGFTRFIECGVGEVLSGLIRRIDREAEVARA